MNPRIFAQAGGTGLTLTAATHVIHFDRQYNPAIEAQAMRIRPGQRLVGCDRIQEYPLVMTNSSPWYRWPIEIDGLPIENGDFPWQTVSHNQMVYLSIFRRDVAKPRKAVLTLTNQKDGYEIL